MHENNMWTARHVGVDGHWEDKLIIFTVEVVKVILYRVRQHKTNNMFQIT